MKNANYNQTLANAKIQGVENCKAILVDFHKKGIEKGFPFMNDYQKENKLIQRTANFYSNYTAQKIYKEYAETFQEYELTASEITEMGTSWKARNGELARNENIEYSVALMG